MGLMANILTVIVQHSQNVALSISHRMDLVNRRNVQQEEYSAFDYPTYMDDINRAKDLIKHDGVIIASLSGSSLGELCWLTTWLTLGYGS
jgi:hypothetical protein